MLRTGLQVRKTLYSGAFAYKPCKFEILILEDE
jgi:hypothetical protein